MPRKRKYYRRRRKRYGSYLTPYITATAPAVGYLATKIAKRVVKKYVNTEYKHHDVTQSGTGVDTTGAIIPMTLIAQGDDFEDRNGRQIKIISMTGNMNVTQNSSATNTQLRAILFIDKEQNGTIPLVSGVDDGVLDSANVYSLRNMNQTRRFVTLFDKIFSLSATGSTNSTIRRYKKLMLKVRYDGTAASQANQKENNIYLLLLSNEATNTPTVKYQFRFRYIDN